MLQNLSEEIRECLRRAEECKRLAKTARNLIRDEGLSRHGAALVKSSPQLRVRRATVEFHEAVQEAGTILSRRALPLIQS
jgi:hypothetical protein